MTNPNELTRAERVRLSALGEALASYRVNVPKTDVILARAKEFADFIKETTEPG